MFLLVFYLFLALVVSFLCSIMESVLLSVSPSYAAVLEKRSPKVGRNLRKLKKDIDKPLAAILSLNTIAHTIGAAGVGAQSLLVFGNSYVALTSVVLTFLILVLSEIIPKTLGALFCRKLAPATTRTLGILIFLLAPLVWLSKKITGLFSNDKRILFISRDEIRAMADIGTEEGLFLERESRILKNLMKFGALTAEDVMTPRPVMFVLPESMTIGEVQVKHPVPKFSRIPICSGDPDDIGSYVLKNDILLRLAEGKTDIELRELKRNMLVVPEMVSLYQLIEQMLDTREHIALAVDEYGGIAGVVTMEDIVETMLGIEIVDETDTTINMRKLAREQWYKRAKALGLVSDTDSAENFKQRKAKNENG